MWLMGRIREEGARLFLDFVEPEEAKGIRFLFRIEAGKKPEAFMYLPATGRTLRVDPGDPSTDVGGTGLTLEVMLPFLNPSHTNEKLIKEEKAQGRECYVVEISERDNKEKRIMWISKGDMNIVKLKQIGPKGKTKRLLRVVEFFTNKEGRVYPREEEIIVPKKRLRIRVRQAHGIFGVDIPEELFDPAAFGTYRWRD